MAKTGCASLCLLLVLATFAQLGLGQARSTHVHNSASYDVAYSKYLAHYNGTVTGIPGLTLAQGATEVFEVPADVKCITASYFELPDLLLGQVVLDWCTEGMPIACLPNCYWLIDNKGFSVAGSEDVVLEFVSGWEFRSTGP